MLLNEFFQKPSLLEGGNIFKGDLATVRINQADVLPTVVWLEKYTGLPLQDNMLGTTGRKDTSGDLDLGVDNKSITKEQLVAKLGEVAKAMGVDPRDIIKKSGISVHFRTPIAGDPNKGYVQTDFMFTDDTEWTKFAAAASGTSTYKGAHKHVVMSSIAASMNLKWSPTLGLVTRDTGNVLSKDPDYIAEILLGKGYDRSDLASVETILDAIKNDPERDEKLMAARETLAKEGVTLPEAKQLAGPAGQVKGMDRARTVKPRPFAGSQPHPFQGKLVGSESVREAANPAQQAAIAIAKKKAKGMREDANPTDKVSMDIPLLIRIMEYAREDAQTDMDLHNVAEKLIALSKEGLTLGMDSYDAIVGNEQPVDEDIVEEGLLGKAAGLIGAYYGVQLGVPDAVMQTMDMPFGTYEIVKHLLGAGVGYVIGNAVGDAAVSGTKKLIAKMLWTGIQKTIQSIKGGKPKEQAWKDYETEIAALYEKIKQKQAAEKINNKFEPVVTRKTNEQSVTKATSSNVLSQWKNKEPAGYVKHLQTFFGPPEELTNQRAIWYNKDGFKRIEVLDEFILHASPLPHYDYVYSYVDMKVPHNLSDELAASSESILIDHLKGEVGARCASLSANAVTLQYVMDVVEGNIKPAKGEYETRIKLMKKMFADGERYELDWWPDVTGDTDPENPYYKESKLNDSIIASGGVAEAKKKPKPTNPELWSRAKAAARSKFEVYPSAYANAWASRWYKGKGGGWRMG